MPHQDSHQQQRAVVQVTVQDIGVESAQRKRRRPNSSTLTDADYVGVIDNEHIVMESYPRAKMLRNLHMWTATYVSKWKRSSE
jgi:hypothetical protein